MAFSRPGGARLSPPSTPPSRGSSRPTRSGRGGDKRVDPARPRDTGAHPAKVSCTNNSSARLGQEYLVSWAFQDADVLVSQPFRVESSMPLSCEESGQVSRPHVLPFSALNQLSLAEAQDRFQSWNCSNAPMPSLLWFLHRAAHQQPIRCEGHFRTKTLPRRDEQIIFPVMMGS